MISSVVFLVAVWLLYVFFIPGILEESFAMLSSLSKTHSCLCSQYNTGFHVRVQLCGMLGVILVTHCYWHQSLLAFSCLGSFCSETVLCNASPCLNGATCEVWNNTYQCKCPVRYTGRNCQQGENVWLCYLGRG